VVDPHEGYRSALTNPDPITKEPSALADTTMVVDPFHVVRLANMAVTRCRTRVQQATLEHRWWKGDPLYDMRKLSVIRRHVGCEWVATMDADPGSRT
jgi:hypothetical protein